MNIFKEVFIMKTVQISLNSIGKVKSFVNTISQFEYDFDLISGRYVIDAKSIMGIFSLDLTRPLTLTVHGKDELEEISSAITPYLKK
jgi:phosphocarrier protein HPr